MATKNPSDHDDTTCKAGSSANPAAIIADSPVVIYGGNGFVGTAIVKALVKQNTHCIVVSRSGEKKGYLDSLPAEQRSLIRWCEGDASAPDSDLLSNAFALVCAIGSPPVPTFSKAAFDQQVLVNGTAIANLLNAASAAGLTRLVLVGAHIPSILRSRKFGYYIGKELALEAATRFAAKPGTCLSGVLQPSMVYGTRYTGGGAAVPLGKLFRPLAALQLMAPYSLARFLPVPFVAADDIGWATTALINNPETVSAAVRIVSSRALATRDLTTS